MAEKFNIVERLDTHEDLINYAVDFLTDDDNTVFISEYGTIDEIADRLFDFDSRFSVIDKTNGEIEFDEIVYIKRKAEDIFAIYNVFDEDGNISKEIEGDFVLLEAGLLLPNIIDEYVIANEEIEICGLDNTDMDIEVGEEGQEMCCECRDCDCKECQDENEDDVVTITIKGSSKAIDELIEQLEYLENR